MSERYFADLCLLGEVAGRRASPQDYQDALRSVSDAHIQAQQLGDERVLSLCTAVIAALVKAIHQPAAPASSPAPYGPRVSRKLQAVPF
jgi:hypothetical protein